MKNKKSRNTQGMRQWKKFKRNKMAVIALIVLDFRLRLCAASDQL